MLTRRVCVLLTLSAIVVGTRPSPALSGPVYTKSPVPYWHLPCGDVEERDPTEPRDLDEDIRISLRNLRIQHELMLSDYLSKDYEFLYERVRIGVHEHQYIPNWLPGKKDVHAVKKLTHVKPQMVSMPRPCTSRFDCSIRSRPSFLPGPSTSPVFSVVGLFRHAFHPFAFSPLMVIGLPVHSYTYCIVSTSEIYIIFVCLSERLYRRL
jgi:hypothetical protein